MIFYSCSKLSLLICLLSIFLMSSCTICPYPEHLPGEFASNSNSISFDMCRSSEKERKYFTLYNFGHEDITLVSLRFDSSSSDSGVFFRLGAPVTTPVVLRPGRRNGIRLSVVFLPDKSKEMKSAILLFSSSEQRDVYKIRVFGRANCFPS